MHCKDDRAPSPNGFNIGLLQKLWSVIKGNIIDMFREFYEAGSFLKGLNCTSFFLIPKMERPPILKTLGQSTLLFVFISTCKCVSKKNGYGGREGNWCKSTHLCLRGD